MPSPALRCSVVIPTYNAAATLEETLGALATQSVPPTDFEVVVADNGSTDASARVASGWLDRLPHLRVIDASRVRGVAAARNDGIRAARTDQILICDADDVADPGWVGSMLAALQAHAFVGGALDIRRINRVERQGWMAVDPITSALPEVWGRRYAFGGNLGVRRDVWAAVGGFDESYGAGAEEIDFAWRVAEHGVTPVFVPDAVIHYRVRPDLRSAVRQQLHSGLGTAQLFATFRPREVPVRRWHRRLRHEVALLGRFPWRSGRQARGAWLCVAAYEVGMARGALRHRTALP